MKKRSMKLICLTVLTTMCVSLFAGCGQKENTDDKSSAQNETKTVESTAKTAESETVKEEVPEAQMPEELTIFANLPSGSKKLGAEDYNDVASFRLMEELTGCHVNWIHPASVNESFNLMISSGELPDCIVYSWRIVANGVGTYYDDGVIIDLADMIDQYMPNLSAYLKENPDVKKQISTDDGKILYIPFIRKDPQLCRYQGPIIRKDWLDKLGLEIPKTTDDLYEVLKAFKTQDPNGNGEADEIPMTGIRFEDTTNGIGNLVWAFGSTYDFCLEDGKVIYGPMTENFKTGLEYVRKLFAEELIDPDYLLNDSGMFKSKITTNVSGFAFNYQPTAFYDVMKDTGAELVGINYLEGSNGEKSCYNPYYVQNTINTSLAITTANKNPEGTLKWLDNFFGGEGYNYMNFGEEGVSYTMVDGQPILTPEVLKVDETVGSNSVNLYIANMSSGFPSLQDFRYYSQTLSSWGRDAVNTWFDDDVNVDNILPVLTFTSDEQSEITDTMAQIKTYVIEEITNAVLGRTDVKDWDKVVETMKSMGIENVLEIYNTSLERYNAR